MKKLIVIIICAVFAINANAQSLFKLSVYSDITCNDKNYKPKDIYDFDFKKTLNGYTVVCPNACALTLSNDLVYIEKEHENSVTYILWDRFSINDKGNYTKGIAYSKDKNSCLKNPYKTIFSIVDGGNLYHMINSYILYFLPNNNTKQADQALSACTLDEDKLIGFMKSFKNIKRPVQNNYNNIKLSGYYCFWNDYYGKKSEGDNGTLTVETRTNHYIGVMHKNNITNISPNRYKRIRWSTRRGAIKVNLPKGVAIGQNDKIICWETNGSSSDPDYRVVVLFAWNPSTHTLLCLRTVKRHWNGKTINDWYYFSTTEANVWSKIQPKIMSELPYCGTRIE